MRPDATFCSSRPASDALETCWPFTDEDHVALTQRAGRRTVRIDFGDDGAGLARRHLQPSRDLAASGC